MRKLMRPDPVEVQRVLEAGDTRHEHLVDGRTVARLGSTKDRRNIDGIKECLHMRDCRGWRMIGDWTGIWIECIRQALDLVCIEHAV
ncbi:hypothetical protein THS5294_01328 [Thalassobacter stenotrophicus]|uniref:Uncharacterized protein n=1 Tax=Thalassobacter stenotrophicus TaxID=266809 RepID=A0A0P1EY23_9RHOB|nr:hypothetical protein THS5294_01328 [Thalassobacter stenotrophicus]